MYRRAKRDANERKIIEFLLRCRCSVQQLDDPGVPDLLVGTWWGANLLLEVKSKAGSLTKSQIQFFSSWHGQVNTVKTVQDVKRILRTHMPTYVYQCVACKHTWQKRQSFKDDPEILCPSCGESKGARVPQPVAIVFKGEGWAGKNDASQPTTVSIPQ